MDEEASSVPCKFHELKSHDPQGSDLNGSAVWRWRYIHHVVSALQQFATSQLEIGKIWILKLNKEQDLTKDTNHGGEKVH